jgi:hypothetical protein
MEAELANTSVDGPSTVKGIPDSIGQTSLCATIEMLSLLCRERICRNGQRRTIRISRLH